MGKDQPYEVKTYRYYGHFSGEAHILPEPYRSEEEIEFYRMHDPIEEMKFVLRSEGVSEEDFIALEEEVKQTIDHAVTFMKESPLPKPEDAYEDAYAVVHESMPVKGWS